MSEPKELEKTATAYASEAILCEKQGEIEKAVSLYQKASECLNILIQRFPNYGFSNIYNDRLSIYQERSKVLQAAITNLEPKKRLPKNQESTMQAEEKAAKNLTVTDFTLKLEEINRKLEQISNIKNERSVSIDFTPVLQEINKKFDEMAIANNDREKSIDFTPVFEEINKKIQQVSSKNIENNDSTTAIQDLNKRLDDFQASITELKNEISVVKLNINDLVGKTEQTHKEIAELRTLLYSIKYDR